MSCPVFKVGDLVEFEITNAGTPRYGQTGIDYTEEGETVTGWCQGIVLEVHAHFMYVNGYPACTSFWVWPLPGHRWYSPDQWQRPGYLKHATSMTSIPVGILDVGKVKSMRPCLYWIDEVEKSLSGTKSSNHSDGGTLNRVFGTLLHAMQEELDGVTLIATSNDISVLPEDNPQPKQQEDQKSDHECTCPKEWTSIFSSEFRGCQCGGK